MKPHGLPFRNDPPFFGAARELPPDPFTNPAEHFPRYTMYPDINYLAVFVASLIPMVTGALWYGPLFGQKWMDMVGKTEEELKAAFNPAKSYGVTWVFALIMAYVMAHVLGTWGDAYGAEGWMAGVQTGFWLWLGFVLTIGWQRVAFEDVSTGLWGLNTLYNLVTLMAMGVLLSVW